MILLLLLQAAASRWSMYLSPFALITVQLLAEVGAGDWNCAVAVVNVELSGSKGFIKRLKCIYECTDTSCRPLHTMLLIVLPVHMRQCVICRQVLSGSCCKSGLGFQTIFSHMQSPTLMCPMSADRPEAASL